MSERQWVATPRQAEFLLAEEDECLYGGAAGGGKSDALLIFAIKRRTEIPYSRGLILRRTFPELEKTLLLRAAELLTGTGAQYDSQRHRWRFPNGSIQEFGYCEAEADVYRYQGAEYEDICFDELTHFTETQYLYLLSRNRTTKVGVKPLIRAATNPGNVGHGWVKSRFIDPHPTGGTHTDERGRTIRFVPAKIQDNPHLMQADPGYIQRLKALPDDDQAALLYGDWDRYQGQVFREWRRGKHVIEPIALPGEWRRFASLDWGRNAPGALYWYAVSPDKRIYVYRELYFSGRNAYDVGQEAAELSRGESIDYCAADPSLWNKESREGRHGDCIADDFRAAGFPLTKADNDRKNGLERVHAFLADAPDGLPWLQVFATCTNLIRTLPALPYDKRRVEDVDTDAEDHAYDSLRYGLMSRPTPDKGRVVRPIKPTRESNLPFALRSEKPKVSWYDR